MSLRQKLSDAISLLDQHPEIKIETFSKSLNSAIETFEKKFKEAQKILNQKPSEDLKSSLVHMSLETAAKKIDNLSDKDFAALCSYLKITPTATKKLSARENAQAKLAKKINEIRKQTK